MRLMMTWSVLVCLSVASVHAEDIDPKNVPAVKKALEKAEAGVRRNRKAYEEANEKVFAEAKKTLKDEVERLSKAGKPEEAVAVKKIMDTLQEESLLGEGSADAGQSPKGPTVAAKEQGVVVFNGHRYKMIQEQLSWDDAKKHCEQMGGHLLVVDDRVEQQFLAKAIADYIANTPAFPEKTGFWLGISRDKDEKWVTVTGHAVLYSNWLGGHPRGDGFAYAKLRRTGEWESVPADSGQKLIICEWEK